MKKKRKRKLKIPYSVAYPKRLAKGVIPNKLRKKTQLKPATHLNIMNNNKYNKMIQNH